MKVLKTAVIALAMGAFLCTGCQDNKGENGGGETPAADFTFKTTDLTQASFSVEITPSDGTMPYYFGLVSKSDYQTYGGGSLLQEANLDVFETLAGNNGMSLEQLLIQELLSGTQTYTTRLLTPGTEYVFYAYGLSTEGVALTEVNTYEFTSPAASFVSGVTFEITGTDVTPTSFTLNVTPSDPDVFYYSDVMLESTYRDECGGTPEGVATFVKDWIQTNYEEYYSEYSMPFFIANTTFRGPSSDSESFVNLLAETDYYAFAVGVANDGSIVTDATVAVITTSETPKNEYKVSNERVTDVTYSASVTATQSEAFAVMMERQYFFSEEDTDAEIIQALYDANSQNITAYVDVDSHYASFSGLIPDEDYYLLVFACNNDGTPKLDEGKVNLLKYPVRTSAATATDVVFELTATNVDRTTATLNVYAVSGTNASEETFMFNYMTKAEYDALAAQVTETLTLEDLLKAHMDEFYQARFETWLSEHPGTTMDIREYRSRTLESGAGLVMPVSYSLTGLTSGTEYVAYMFGMKADGSYTTSVITEEFTTLADAQCAASIRFMYNQMYASSYGDRVYLYVYGYPSGDFDRYYMKLFAAGTDDWEGKSASEVLTLLQQESAFTRNGWSVSSYVNLNTMWYFYGVCFDKAGIATDVYKASMTVPETGSNVSGDLTVSVL